MNAQPVELVPYAPPRLARDLALDLSKNEGRAPAMPSSPMPSAADLARYPDLDRLREAMAATFGTEVERVLVTAGGDDALLRVCLARLRNGAAAVLCEPTFEMIARYVRLAGGTVLPVAWPDGPFPVEAVLAACEPAPAVVFVVSPNNPTGAVATANDVQRLARDLPDTLLVLDLAYEEFADEPLQQLAATLPNALVVRTLSKAWSLAGLRVGAAIGAPSLLAELAAAGNPMPVSVASAQLACARLSCGTADVAEHVAMVGQQRRELIARLRAWGLDPAEPAQGNFVLVRGLDAERTTRGLSALSIGVRRFPSDPRLLECVRIALPGTDHGFARLVRSLASMLAPEALLFDMDGVLVDVRASYRVAIVETAKAFGVSLTQDDVAAAKARGDCNDDWRLTQDLLRERGVDVPFDDVVACFESIYQPLSVRERPMVERAFLERLRSRFRLGVVTGRPRIDAERFLAQSGLRDCFDVVVCREDAPLKPDPAPVRLALQRLGVAAAWMLGDTVDDVRAAAAALVLPVGIAETGEVPGAAFTLRMPSELEPFLP